MLNKEEISSWLMGLQDRICSSLEEADGKAKFIEDKWKRKGGGGGRSRIIQNGNVIEKGGVGFSAVHGILPGKISEALGVKESEFFATGVSIVMHPISPMVPIIHMNVRYFELTNGIKWFGGGIDLTPHYIDKEDAVFFHSSLKKACDLHNAEYYQKFKSWADDYFFIKHRDETRGIGGIFFDKLTEVPGITIEDRFNFVKEVGNTFAPLYTTLMGKNKNKAFNDQNKLWQDLRRSRYVEFNLVYDKGTKFGLDTEGRTESILMSMPPQARWIYNYVPEPGSDEENTQRLLKKDINWIA